MPWGRRAERAGVQEGGCESLVRRTAHMGRNEPFGLASGVAHCVTGLSVLEDSSLLLEFREISRCCGV